MVYTILISIVFIAEVIIMITVIQNLLRLDKAVLLLDDTLDASKSGIREICVLGRKISQQLVVISDDFVEKVKQDRENAALKVLSKALIGVLVLKLNFKIIKKFRKSRMLKTLAKGLSFLGSMV